MGTLIVLAVVVAIVAAAIVSIIKKKKAGGGCGCGSSGCTKSCIYRKTESNSKNQ